MDFYPETSSWVAVDTETGGLNPWVHDVIEIGAARFHLQKGIEERFQVLIRPQAKQDPRARAVHNISNEELEEKGIDSHTAMQRFTEFVKNDPLVFHNAPFDISFLIIALQKNKMPLLQNYYYDNLFLSRKYFKERKSHSLAALKQTLKIETGQAHRALSDAEATAMVFMETIRQKLSTISKTKMRDFLRYHRRFDEFEIKLPKDLARIEKYFQGYIRRGELLKIQFYDQRGRQTTQSIRPLEFMIFNQKLYIKGISLYNQQENLFPISGSTVFDAEKGSIRF